MNVAAALLSGASGTTVGASTLTQWAASRAGIISADSQGATQDPNAPIAPVWTPGVSPSAEALVQRALTNKSFFDTNAKLYSDLGASGDYKKLFALYSGLTTLQALAGHAEDTSLSKAALAQTQAQFARGLTELEAFFAQQKFDDIRLSQGDRVDTAQTTLAMASKSEDYTTPVIHRGGLYDKITGLASDAKFNIVATSLGGTVRNVAIDLSEMGSLPRTLSNVVSYVNGKLSAAGAASRLEALDQTPKTVNTVIGGKVVATKYTGAKQFALKVDVNASEKVSFQPVDADPAFYAVGTTANGARLIKLEDVGGATGQPVLLDRARSTVDPIGALIGAGWIGAGAPYTSAPAGATEQRTNAMTSDGANTFEDALRAAGEAVLKLELPDGRSLSVTTAWRSDDLEAWRVRAGESEDQGMLDDLAERLTQLLHEQGVAAGVEVWEDDGKFGLSIYGGDGVRASSLSIGGKFASLDTVETPGMVGGLRDGVFARRFEVAGIVPEDGVFTGTQTFTFTTGTSANAITIDGGDDGVSAAQLQDKLNVKLRQKGLAAAAYLVDNGGSYTLRIDALHDMVDVGAVLNSETVDADIVAPGAWASGGLPNATSGQPFGDSIRTYGASGSPLSTHLGALNIEVVVATANGNKTVNLAITAQDRLDNLDLAPGRWNSALQARLDLALNAAGVYVSAPGGELTQWNVAEGAGQRLVSVSVNGDALALEGDAPTLGVGGAFSAQRSFTSAQATTGVSDDVAALLSDQNVSITLDTTWGPRTISAVLEPGDPRTLESAALRLNEALAAGGYDAGLVATNLSGGGAGLRVVTGSSNTVRGVTNLDLGGSSVASTLDPIDAASRADDPVGALRVFERASRGAAITQTLSATSPFTAPSVNSSAWFAGRAFDVSVGGGAKVATARAVATAADGSVYVLADLSDGSSTTDIKGARDVALLKYDSAGKLAFSEILGAAQSASGYALAVSADGKVAVAGSIEGAFSGTTAKGGADSFVTMFDAAGKELWTARRGASANDEALAIAFAPDGSVVVSGKTDSALSGQVGAGGSDGYLRGYSAAGLELFTRQFGTSGADAASALVVRDNGVGGIDIFTGGVEDNRGVVRSFSYASGAGLTVGATRDLGYFYKGAINALVVDGSSLYVGGEIGADRLTLASTARGAVAGQEGFVARINADLTSTGLDRATYLGSAQDDAVKSLAIVNGNVYAAGVTGGAISGTGAAKSSMSFLTRLGSDGETDWMRSFTSSGGSVALTGLAVDTGGASALDILGLPRGALPTSDSSTLTNRSALRAGDEFKIGVDGRRLTTIKIGDKDTIQTLATAINRAIGSAGRAEIVKADGVERIKITPRSGQALRLDPGGKDRDALPALGLGQGIIAESDAGRAALKTYGLGLVGLTLDGKTAISNAKSELSAAISIVRIAYDAMLNPNAKAMTDEEKALQARRQNMGAAPEYYTAKLANYQAALTRLTGE
ncbi:hypothetical protein ATE48_18170 [Candidatus Viadribacter manganicus]|uniref:Regulatory protein FlaEY n=2 Tax=Candidatus Viadribacter manganicus TaxID=1759059 RepID=A0A1B1AM99_9PROT|nr:hypothetical protein ATE48_18170 [Candidatus Viadribacter manganicus]